MRVEEKATAILSATYEGNITVGSHSVIHPHAVIKAGEGEIIMGKNNIVEEFVVIENKGPPGSIMVIGDDNIFKVKCQIYAKKIGNNNTIGVKAIVGEGTEITNLCSICPLGEYHIRYEPLKERTVIYNGNLDQRTSSEISSSTQQRHAEILRTLLTNFHKGYKNKNESKA